MTRMTLQMLGPLIAADDHGNEVELGYDKVRALLAYLVVEHKRAHSRSRLAGLLWPDSPEDAARHSLSQALSTLRRAVGADQFSVSRQLIQFHLTSEWEIDLHQFQELVTGDEGDVLSRNTAVPIARLEQAVKLPRGSFLEGFSLEDASEFEDWVRSVQESFQHQFTQALSALIDYFEQAGELEQASAYARRRIELDPWEEAHHRTAMRLLAASGRRSEAIKQYEACVEILKRDLDIEPEAETIELGARIRSGVDHPAGVEPAPGPTPPMVRPVLPVPASPTVGRDDEIAEIAGWLRHGERRLVTLVGPGGIGKSRLALEVARRLEPEMPDGACCVGLAGIQEPDYIASSILTATSAAVDPDEDSESQLLWFLQPRRLLLLLDNFEHLIRGAPLLHRLLEHAPGLSILVTSRERLSLTSETVYETGGLSLPDNTDSPSIAVAGATRLFMLNARKHKPSFLPSAEEGPAIARIAHLTGGMPLALELAAAWISVLTPAEIADEIAQSLDFLAASMRDLPERHQSVRAVVDRSWDNLSSIEQRTFRRLSICRGGFTRSAARVIAGASLPVLSALVSKSFLRFTSQGRYEVHELLRQYAQNELANEANEAEIVRDRHRDFFLDFLTQCEDQLQGREQAKALEEIAIEIDNIRAALRCAVDTSDYLGLGRVAHSLWLYFEITGRYREGAEELHGAFEALSARSGNVEVRSPEFRWALARVRSRWASVGFRMHGPVALRRELQAAIDEVRELGDPAEEGMLLNFQAVAAHTFGELELEEDLLHQSIRQFEQAGHRWGLAYSQNDLGHVLALRGDFATARALHQQALQTLEDLGDSRGIAFALRNLGIVAHQMGDDDQALELLRRSVDIRRPIGNYWGIAESLRQIGALLRERGHDDAARDHFREALVIAREIRAMQLAAEILPEFLPLLPDSLARQQAIALGTIDTQAALDEFAVSRIAELVDSVLDQAYEPVIPMDIPGIEGGLNARS